MIKRIVHNKVPDTIELAEIDFSVADIRYETEGGSLCKLQFLGGKIENMSAKWGFVYLNRPALKPVFVRSTGHQAVLAAMEAGHTLTWEKCVY